jgi:hypothetical protein
VARLEAARADNLKLAEKADSEARAAALVPTGPVGPRATVAPAVAEEKGAAEELEEAAAPAVAEEKEAAEELEEAAAPTVAEEPPAAEELRVPAARAVHRTPCLATSWRCCRPGAKRATRTHRKTELRSPS